MKIFELHQWLAAACGPGIVMLVFACANPVDKKDTKPQLSVVSDTTVSVKDSLQLTVHTETSGGKATGYSWLLDAHPLAFADSVCRLFFSIHDTGMHEVIVTGINARNILSDPETTKVQVLLNPPVVHFETKDTALAANDSVILVAAGTDPNGSVTGFQWQIDTSSSMLLSKTGTLTCCFGPPRQTHCVRVVAMDDDSIMSAPDSVHIQVIVNPPQIAAQHDTTGPINDTMIIHAVRLDTFSTTIRWLWAKNGTTFSDTTIADSCSVRFGRNEAGVRRILVKAIDSHRIESNIDSLHVHVLLKPPTVSIVHDTIVPINDPAVFRAHGADSNGYIVKYVWALDGTNFVDTTAVDSIAHVYSRADMGRHVVVRVKVFDDDTVESNSDSVHVTVHLKPSPYVAITHDTSVFINDTFIIAAKGTESGSKSPVVAYVWAVDKTLFDDTTKTGFFTLHFGRPDAGRHVVRVKAVDRDTMESPDDSLVVQVRLGAPAVTAMKDTAVFINDTAFLHASGTDSNGTVVRYLWACDGGSFTDTTTSGMLRKAWAQQDTGRHTVRVLVVDDDTIQSRPDSFTVEVLLGMPVILAVHDTNATWGDTVAVAVAAHDTNGTIQRYLWTFGDGTSTWNDSAATGTMRLTNSIHSRMKVVVGVRDDDGLVARDTFFIDFRAVHCSLSVRGAAGSDTMLLRTRDSKQVTTPLSFSARRTDGIADTFTYSFWSGTSPTALVRSYQGRDTVCTLKTLDTGTYYWKLVAVDGHADTAATPVSALSIMLQRRICFIGHSIITGLCGTAGRGGMRRMIIDTLRAKAGNARKIACEGPLLTKSLLPQEDDSCLAVGGNSCANIYDSLFIYPSTTADIWVYMNGANDEYYFPTYNYKYGLHNYTAMTIDSMHSRNPRSEIYVFNALPFPADTEAGFSHLLDSIFIKNLPLFNRMLDSLVTLRRQTWEARGEAGVWLVDAFTAMATPDSFSNKNYFFDFLHPNQQGYDVMAGVLLKAMRAASSSFYK
jgi:lysophospholipase L1-like esterase